MTNMIIEKASLIPGYYQGRLTGQHSCILGKTRDEVMNSLFILIKNL